MMLVCSDESVELSPEERTQIGPATEAWVEEMDRRGIRLEGNQLRPVADTKEQIAGYDIIDCADLDEAIEVASKHPVARFGRIEVRPFWVD